MKALRKCKKANLLVGAVCIMSFTLFLSWCTLLVVCSAFLSQNWVGIFSCRKGEVECNPGREHCQVLAPTWTKKEKRTGPEHGNIVPESLLLLGSQNILVLICILSEAHQRRLLQCRMNEQMNESTHPSTHPYYVSSSVHPTQRCKMPSL